MEGRKKRKTVYTIVFVLFFLYAVTLVSPFFWLLYNSLKTNQEFFANVWALPQRPRYSNYVTALNLSVNGSNVVQMIFNSLILVAGGTFLSILSCAGTSYVFAKFKFPGHGFLFALVITLMIIPSVGATTGTYRPLNNLGLYNNLIGVLILYAGGFGMPFLIVHAFYKNLSWTFAEAAMMDGASQFTIFIRLMLPLAKSVLISMAILQGISLWNDFFTPYMYLPAMPTLAVGLDALNTLMLYSADFPRLFALMIISLVPVLLIFVLFQDVIMNNVSVGGLKG